MKSNDPYIKALLRYITDTPELLSLLYDIEWMPEQLEEGTADWCRMLIISEAWRNRKP